MKIVTANRLSDGFVIYWVGPGRWSTAIEDATLLEGATLSLALEDALADPQAVVAPYPVAMAEKGVPDGRVRTRETIRMRGPTVACDFRPGRTAKAA